MAKFIRVLITANAAMAALTFYAALNYLAYGDVLPGTIFGALTIANLASALLRWLSLRHPTSL
jgi:hypothetical protein